MLSTLENYGRIPPYSFEISYRVVHFLQKTMVFDGQINVKSCENQCSGSGSGSGSG